MKFSCGNPIFTFKDLNQVQDLEQELYFKSSEFDFIFKNLEVGTFFDNPHANFMWRVHQNSTKFRNVQKL
jgi:hypothetical protein